MKLSDGFSKLLPSVLTFVFWESLLPPFFILVLKCFDLSYAYAVWAGVGILTVSISGFTISGISAPITCPVLNILISAFEIYNN